MALGHDPLDLVEDAAPELPPPDEVLEEIPIADRPKDLSLEDRPKRKPARRLVRRITHRLRGAGTVLNPKRAIEHVARKPAKARFDFFINVISGIGIIGAVQALVFLNIAIVFNPTPFWARSIFLALEGSSMAYIAFIAVNAMVARKILQEKMIQKMIQQGPAK